MLTATLLAAAGCKPDLGDPPSLIKSLSVLAVRAVAVDEEVTSTPDSRPVHYAEAQPGQVMHYDLLVVDPSGTVTGASANFDICLKPKPPAEGNSVASECVTDPAEREAVASADATIPAQACALFGPISPPAPPGEPPFRPRDSDSTGGFYVPVRTIVRASATGEFSRTAFSQTRVLCGLAGAGSDIIQAYKAAYQRNIDPHLLAVSVFSPSLAATPLVPAAVDPPAVRAGEIVTFQVKFADDASETFPLFDRERQELSNKRESLSLAWFTTAGKFDLDRTGRAESATAATTDNKWTAPLVTTTTAVHFWFVLRDSRGGVDFTSADLTIVP